MEFRLQGLQNDIQFLFTTRGDENSNLPDLRIQCRYESQAFVTFEYKFEEGQLAPIYIVCSVSTFHIR